MLANKMLCNSLCEAILTRKVPSICATKFKREIETVAEVRHTVLDVDTPIDLLKFLSL